MPRVLIVAEYGTLNGGENSLLAVLPSLTAKGYTFESLCPGSGGPGSGGLASAFQEAAVTHREFEFTHNGHRKPLQELRGELEDAFRSTSPDLVHCNSLSAGRICGPVLSSLNIPSLGYIRDIIKLKRKPIEDLNCLDRIVAVSDATRNFHIEQGIDPARIVTIHNGISDSFLSTGKPGLGGVECVRDELGIPNVAPIVLFVGQIGLRKGLNTWLDAAEQLIDSNPECHFVLVGERHSTKAETIEYESKLRIQATKQTLNGRVHWLGRRNDVPSIMSQSTTLLHCARQEPLGRVLLEACAAGLPIVATDVGGTTEVLTSGLLREFVIPADDPTAASQAVSRIIENPTLRHQLSIAGKENAANRFPVQKCAEQLAEAYRSLCKVPE